MKKFPKYVVKIKCKGEEGEICDFGTGILLDSRKVITARHVMAGNSYSVELIDGYSIDAIKDTSITNDSSFVGVLLLDDKIENKEVPRFCTDYQFNDHDTWEILGYVTSEQVGHHVVGKGLYKTLSESLTTDVDLGTIKVGQCGSYKGLSGAPVFVSDMIIGIAQAQVTYDGIAQGVKIASVHSFVELLPEGCLCENIVERSFRDRMQEYTEAQIKKNISSKKYIEEIFVEEDDNKEFLRCFAQPDRFIGKAIEDIQSLDLEQINEYLEKYKETTISFKFIDKQREEDTVSLARDMSKNLSIAHDLLDNLRKHINGQIPVSLNKYYYETQDVYNRSTKFIIDGIKQNIDFILYRYLVITNEAGQGKTNFVCDFTKNFLLRKDYFVLYFNAYDFIKSPYESIIKKITLLSQLTIERVWALLRDYYNRTSKPFIIVIDGLNENSSLENFSRHIIELLENLQQFEFVKIIMTTRSEFYNERFGGLGQGIYIDKFYNLRMYKKRGSFKKRIFRGYLKYFNISIKPYTLKEGTFNKLAEDTLLLRFFCEAYAGRKHMHLYHVYKYSLFEAYLENKVEEYSNLNIELLNAGAIYQSILDKLIKCMLENHTYHRIPINSFNEEETRLLKHMILSDVILKDEQEVEVGFISKNTVVVSFTFDEFRDYCITSYIAREFDEDTLHEYLMSIQKKYATIAEGVLKYIFYIAKSSNNSDLTSVLKRLPSYNHMYWKNIFEIEDEHLEEEDVEIITSELRTADGYERKVINELVGRYDIDYFKNLNITHLFDYLSELSVNKNSYRQFTQKMFSSYEKDDKYRYDKFRPAYPINWLTHLLSSSINFNQHNSVTNLFVLSIYLYNGHAWHICEVWEHFLKTKYEAAIEFLNDMNNKLPNMINRNLLMLLDDLLLSDELTDDNKVKIQRLHDENSYVEVNDEADHKAFLKFLQEYGE